MRLSTRSRFAITTMIDLALRDSDSPVPLSELAQRHRISLSYLEMVFSKLRKSGLVQSTRGPGGGYSLAADGASVTVADIIGAIEVLTEGRSEEARRECVLNPQALWDSLHTAVFDHMRTITLKSLADVQRAQGIKLPAQQVARKGVLEKVERRVVQPNVPNSVFALGKVDFAFRPR